jgi:hypothetical protein
MTGGFDLVVRSHCVENPANLVPRELAARAELVSYGNDRVTVPVDKFVGAHLQCSQVQLDL